MKSSKFLDEVKNLKPTELKSKIAELSNELMKLRFRRSSAQLEQTHLLLEIRRNIARLKNLLRNSKVAGV